MNSSKKLYVIGVGPGDPDLLTLKAVKILKSVDTLFVPVREKEGESIALNTCRKYLKSKARIVKLLFPMVNKKDILEDAWEKAVENIEKTGKGICGFATIGDPMIYSTFLYIMNKLLDRGFEVEVIPGIPSFTSCSSKGLFPLIKGNESMAIVSRIEKNMDLSQFHTVVVMKLPKGDLKPIVEELKKRGFRDFLYAENVFLEGEFITRDVEGVKRGSYLSMIIGRR